MSQLQKGFQLKNTEIFKGEENSLGIGSYGAVYKARCDELPCAAKILHPTFFQTNDPGARRILQRFDQECGFMNAIRHPNIVQFLGVTRDSESGLPVLLMELLDENLTKFLEQSKLPSPYYVQVNLCHDIALAIAYLHSIDIIHRDLSSNNVLLIAGSKAKVTDFGMSKLIDASGRATHHSLTCCPGTEVYMPPEAFRNPPIYSKKLDCFSFGPLAIQILTRLFPEPGPRTVLIEDPRSPTGSTEMPVMENERRKEHIDLIDPTHSLLPIAKSCMAHGQVERPSADQLCQQLATLKKTPAYSGSRKKNLVDFRSITIEKEREIGKLLLQRKNQVTLIEKLKEESKDQAKIIEKQKRLIDRQFCELHRKLQYKEQVLVELQQTLAQRERKIIDQSKQIQDMQHQLQQTQMEQQQPQAEAGSGGGRVELRWRKATEAPCEMMRGSSAVDGNMAYFARSNKLFQYNSSIRQWTQLPYIGTKSFALVVINKLLTVIGGYDSKFRSTNELVSLEDEEWVKRLPPMPSRRNSAVAVVSGNTLVVAGGRQFKRNEDMMLSVVEVMDIEHKEWFKASDLPHPIVQVSATICNGNIYLIGGADGLTPLNTKFEIVLTCTLVSLLDRSTTQTESLVTVWHRISDLPVICSTCATFKNKLLAIGGIDEETNQPTQDIFQYNPTNDSWDVISQMSTARSLSFAAVLPNDELLVVGGIDSKHCETTSVELATFQS